MKFNISCSFGEIIDKYTILTLKEENTDNIEKLNNIKKEKDCIENETTLVKNNDKLFKLLYNTNKKLWELEDNIRLKSKNKEFDNEYIKYAEDIHINNDLRYEIKRKINIKYNSDIIEEKIYNKINIKNNDLKVLSKNDMNDLILVKNLFMNGKYKIAYKNIEKIISKYDKGDLREQNIMDLYISYNNILEILNIKNKYYDKLIYIFDNINKYNYSNEFKEFYNHTMTMSFLLNNDYKRGLKYINLMNVLTGPGINKYNMSYFKKEDKNCRLLIYNGGGIGDFIMMARFIPELCNINNEKNNKIVIMVDDKLYWIYNKVFNYIDNLEIIKYSQRNNIKFDYHCNIFMLLKYLNYNDYKKIPFIPYLNKIEGRTKSKIIDKINELKKNGNPTYVFNWHGNYKNKHEITNRGISLFDAKNLFKSCNDINWIIVSKENTKEEIEFLNKFNITYFIEDFDINKAFEDTIEIFKRVDHIYTTDTSLAHLAGTMDVPTTVLLTLGCEWRWSRNSSKTNWYPNVNLIRQKNSGNWKDVIDEIIQLNQSNLMN